MFLLSTKDFIKKKDNSHIRRGLRLVRTETLFCKIRIKVQLLLLPVAV